MISVEILSMVLRRSSLKNAMFKNLKELKYLNMVLLTK